MIKEASFEAIDWNIDHALSKTDHLSSKALKDICIFEKPLDEVPEHYGEELKAINDNGDNTSPRSIPSICY